METDKLIDGKTAYEILEEKGLLNGLTDHAFTEAYTAHIAQRDARRKESSKDKGHAEVFDFLQKNDPKALAELKRSDPARFDRMQEAYLNRPLNEQTFEEKELTIEEALEMFRQNDRNALEEIKRKNPERYKQMEKLIRERLA